MKFGIERITPKIAESMLGRNTANRRLGVDLANFYGHDMENGEWMENGETIKIDWDGVLLDGQHRLRAIVGTGETLDILVVRDLDPTVMKTIDLGKKRNFGDQLAIQGVPLPNQVSSVVKSLCSIANGTARGYAFTNADRDNILKAHPEITNSIRHIKAFKGVGSYVAAINYVGHFLGHSVAAESFAIGWKTGIEAYENDAVRVARERIIKVNSGSTRIQPMDKLRLCIWSWNCHVQQKQVKSIRVSTTENIEGWNLTALSHRTKRIGGA